MPVCLEERESEGEREGRREEKERGRGEREGRREVGGKGRKGEREG